MVVDAGDISALNPKYPKVPPKPDSLSSPSTVYARYIRHFLPRKAKGKLDYAIVTHYHIDHFSAIAELCEEIPFRTLVDRSWPDYSDERYVAKSNMDFYTSFVKRFPRFRLLVQGVALFLGAPMLVWFGFAPNLISTWVAVAAYGVFRGFFEVNTHASLFDVVAPKYRSTAVGLLNMTAFFFGGLSGLLIGKLSETYGVRGFEIGFAFMGGVYALAGALMLVSFFFTFKRDRVVE